MSDDPTVSVEDAPEGVVIALSGPPGSAAIARLADEARDALGRTRTLVIDVARAPLGRGAAEALDAVALEAERRGARLAIVSDPQRPLAADAELATEALARARIFESRQGALSTLDYVE